MSGGFFGFDTTLPGRPVESTPGPGGSAFQGFQMANDDQFATLGGAGEEEDLAVYQWGEGIDGGLLEGGDDFNDETFGGIEDIGRDFQFSSQPVADYSRPKASQSQPRGPIASTQSRFRPKTTADPFAATEDDFYSSRPTTKKSGKPSVPKKTAAEPLWAKAAVPSPWGAPPPKTVPIPQSTSQSRPPPQKILSIDEVEAEMSRTVLADRPLSLVQQPKVLSLEEIEQQMMSNAPPAIPPPHIAHIPTPPPVQVPTPPPAGLAGSGYSAQQLLDSMFPDIGTAPTPGQAAWVPGTQSNDQAPQGPTPEEIARMDAIHQRITAKIEAMAKYNNLMGNSDKDFITRIQLSQLATSDPYSSDFYAQVYSALVRRQATAEQGPTVVQVAPGMGFGVGGPTGSRFGKMGTASMQRLSSQVKKLVATTAKREAKGPSDALQGALGRVRRGPSQAAPRPVLAVPTASKPEHRPVAQLNQHAGPTRPALTRKQVMYALEELYDDVLDIEQMRRDAPPPTDVPSVEAWNAACQAKVEGVWRKLMVMEPLGGQRLFPRLLRHLPHQQGLTLLTLLIATYPQLDVVARAPPPPVADSSLLTKADRLDRAQREAETDNFLHCVIPGLDALINRCNLGLVSGLLGICAQRMEVWKVASSRPGVALFTALLSKAQSVIRAPPVDLTNPVPDQPLPADPAEVEQWNKTFAYFLQILLPHLPELFPSSQAQKVSFGPGAYLLGSDAAGANQFNEKEGMEIERREAEVWGFAAALAVNAPEEEQTNLVGALREKILHTVQAARDVQTPPARADMKLRNVNMFLHGLGLDASMIE